MRKPSVDREKNDKKSFVIYKLMIDCFAYSLLYAKCRRNVAQLAFQSHCTW